LVLLALTGIAGSFVLTLRLRVFQKTGPLIRNGIPLLALVHRRVLLAVDSYSLGYARFAVSGTAVPVIGMAVKLGERLVLPAVAATLQFLKIARGSLSL
jgi:hypothetical protein